MTKRNQRIAIWVIAIIMGVGSIGSFLVVALTYKNYDDDVKAYQQMTEEAQKSADESEPLARYSARQFNADEVKELKVEVLDEGSGDVVSESDIIKASYFGWLPSGEVFDSTKKTNEDDSPVTFSLAGLITGWKEGLAGQKAGSTVRLTIPYEKAYGEYGSAIIPPNTPLEFIVKINEIVKEE